MIVRNRRFLAALAGITAGIAMPVAVAFADEPDMNPGPVDTVTKVSAHDIKPVPQPVPQPACEPISGAFFSIPIGASCQ